MTFISHEFFAFIAIFAVLYAVTHGRARLWVILISSCIFYGWWDWKFLGLIFFSITLDYFTGRLLSVTEDQRQRNWILAVSVTANLSVLAFFKYANFFVQSTIDLANALGLQTSLSPLNILLPVGISFYTFHSMSYSIDVYRRILNVEKSFVRYAAFVTFFPQLVAGPILRAHLFVPQLRRDNDLQWDNFFIGVRLCLWGYFMKSVVADSLAPYVDAQFGNVAMATSLSLLIAVIFYAFQIYGDFFGYSLIAIGIAKIFGFDMNVNFDRPYFSQSFSEFWQRWHISLSSWLRDYLYIPLGGNRHGTASMYRNLMLTMLLGGLWHGASWNFVIWGALHGLYLVVQRLISKKWGILDSRVPKPFLSCVSTLFVFGLTCLAWIFFRATSLEDALQIIRKIVMWDGGGLSSPPMKFQITKGMALIALVYSLEAISFRIRFDEFFEKHPFIGLFAAAAIVWSLAFIGTYSGNAFIYFQF
jgi:alginate O-acetyltransferase complex protein AlgI